MLEVLDVRKFWWNNKQKTNIDVRFNIEIKMKYGCKHTFITETSIAFHEMANANNKKGGSKEKLKCYKYGKYQHWWKWIGREYFYWFACSYPLFIYSIFLLLSLSLHSDILFRLSFHINNSWYLLVCLLTIFFSLRLASVGFLTSFWFISSWLVEYIFAIKKAKEKKNGMLILCASHNCTYVTCTQSEECLYLFIEIRGNSQQHFHATWYLMMWLSWSFYFSFVAIFHMLYTRSVWNYTIVRALHWGKSNSGGGSAGGWDERKTSKIIWFSFEMNWNVALRSNFTRMLVALIHERKCDKNKWENPN